MPSVSEDAAVILLLIPLSLFVRLRSLTVNNQAFGPKLVELTIIA